MLSPMRSRDNLLRLKRFNLDEKRRRVAQIELMMSEFDRMASELDREITIEQERSGIRDASHFAYSTYARAAGIRRDNLRRSAEDLKSQFGEAQEQLRDALDAVRAFEALTERDRVQLIAPEASLLEEAVASLTGGALRVA